MGVRTMADHIDQAKSDEAIQKEIDEELEKLKKTAAELDEKSKDKTHPPTDHLEKRAREEMKMIEGKRAIQSIVTKGGQDDKVDAEIEKGDDKLKKIKKELEDLRKKDPKPWDEIEKTKVEESDQEATNKGMEKAKGLIKHK
jgi:hypothetical protein